MSIGISHLFSMRFPNNNHVIIDRYRKQFSLQITFTLFTNTIGEFATICSDTNLTVPCTISDVDCECVNYISFSEPPYESAERKWCGKLPYSFRSRSRVLVITYVYQLREYNIFNLTYTTESKWTTTI